MYYFAYASNLSRRQMAERVPQARPRFSAVLPNYKLVFSGYSRNWRGAMATIQSSHGDRVLGGVYEISEGDLPKLDKYEGAPAEYIHLKVLVFPDAGPPIEAVTYIRPRALDEAKPSPEYLAVIREGYRDWGLV